MITGLWLYYITDRNQFPGRQAEQRRRLLDKIGEAARAGVDFIQLREKDLSSHELEDLAREALNVIAESRPGPGGAAGAGVNFSRPTETSQLLINSRTDVAIAVGARGVHLPAGDVSPREVRDLWNKSASMSGAPRREAQAIAGVSCHSVEEVRRAEADGADFAVFAPVFEKVISNSEKRPGTGLDVLRLACELSHSPDRAAKKFPVFALGGITLDNAKACIEAGAVGVAGIRLFQQNDIIELVRRLKNS